MRFVVIFEDQPGMLDIRRERGDQHLQYLAQHANEIRVAGGLKESNESPFVGGLWIMDVASRDRALELIESDPYYSPEHRGFRLLVWNKVQTAPVTL